MDTHCNCLSPKPILWILTAFNQNLSCGYALEWPLSMERCGAVVKRRTRDREVPGSIPTNCKCCFLEQETLSTLLSTGFYPGKKRATWKISTRLLNVLPSINKVDYYYYYYYVCTKPHHMGTYCNCLSPKPVFWVLTVFASHQNLCCGYSL